MGGANGLNQNRVWPVILNALLFIARYKFFIRRTNRFAASRCVLEEADQGSARILTSKMF
jgi:hypothetical protein